LEQERPADAATVARHLGATGEDAAWQQTGWCLAGRASLAAGQAAPAEEAFRRALALDANTRYAAEAALRLGEIVLEAGKVNEAEDYFRRAGDLASDPSLLGIKARAYAGLADTALAGDDAAGAARYYMSVAILYDDPDLVPRCLFRAAEAFGKLGQAEARANALQELTERYPDSEWAKQAQAE
jgi:TolA-binding protein